MLTRSETAYILRHVWHWCCVRINCLLSTVGQQPLRNPAQAAVNVLEHEDVRHMATAAKYKGMLDQTERLHQKFASRFGSYPCSHPTMVIS